MERRADSRVRENSRPECVNLTADPVPAEKAYPLTRVMAGAQQKREGFDETDR